MKILERIASWAEARIVRRILRWLDFLAHFWAEYWLLILGSCLVCGSVIFRWVDFPLSRNLAGIQLPLIAQPGLIPDLRVISYGVVAIIVLAAGLFLSRRFRWSLLIAVTTLATLFVILPFHVGFAQPAILRRLVEEIEDVSLARTFTKRYLPENYGYREDVPYQLDIDTAWGRLAAAWSFLGFGWFYFGVGSTLLATYCISSLPNKRLRATSILVCIPLGTAVCLSIRPLIGQYQFIAGRIAEAEGRNEQAISKYQSAMWWDAWHAQDIDLYAVIGDLQRQSGLAEDSPERHIIRARQFRDAGQFEAAIFEYNQAADIDGPQAVPARRASARTRLEFGLALYRAGAVGAAATNWRESLRQYPAQLEGLLFLARANYELGLYGTAVDQVNQVVAAAGLNSVLANTYSLGGDCYIRLGNDDDARRYYTRSFKLDNDINLWATTGLVGD